jgi:hypothetical protein
VIGGAHLFEPLLLGSPFETRGVDPRS